MDIVKIGEFIKEKRKELNITQKELAQKLGCTDKAISRWETGKGLPDSSFLIPLSNILGVTVNELLSGEKVPAEELKEKVDNNLVSAVKENERVIKDNKLTKVLLAVAIIFCIVSISVLIGTIIKSQNTATYVGSFNTKNRIAVMEMLLNTENVDYYFSQDVVCTDYTIELDSKGDIKKAEIKLNDEFKHEYINILLFTPNEQPQQLSYRILLQRNYISSEDGILFKDLIELLENADIVGECKKHSKLKEYDTITLSGMSTLYFNFNDQSYISFSNQHLFEDGELKKKPNASGMKGKFFEIVLNTFNKASGEYGSCFSIYIER